MDGRSHLDQPYLGGLEPRWLTAGPAQGGIDPADPRLLPIDLVSVASVNDGVCSRCGGATWRAESRTHCRDCGNQEQAR